VQLKIAELANTQTYLFEHFTSFKLSQLVLDFGSNTSQTTGRRQSSNKRQADDKIQTIESRQATDDNQSADKTNDNQSADKQQTTTISRQTNDNQQTNNRRQSISRQTRNRRQSISRQTNDKQQTKQTTINRQIKRRQTTENELEDKMQTTGTQIKQQANNRNRCHRSRHMGILVPRHLVFSPMCLFNFGISSSCNLKITSSKQYKTQSLSAGYIFSSSISAHLQKKIRSHSSSMGVET
jgi:hypothetical protein